jgi:hypothetical protein
MPTTLLTETGVAVGCPSSRTESQPGVVSRVKVAIRGTTSTKVVAVRPPASRTVRWIRYHTFTDVSPVVGITNDPALRPEVGGRNGWTWVSWWKSTCHVNAACGRTPSSASEPAPM